MVAKESKELKLSSNPNPPIDKHESANSLQSKMRIEGTLEILHTDKNGVIIQNKIVPNLIVNSGLAYVISRMKDTSKNVMSHMACGSSSTSPASGDTDLGSVLGSRKSLTSTTITGSNNEKVAYVCSFAGGEATGAIVEAGLFNASSGGDMLCRTTFAVVNKGSTDGIVLTWTLTLSAS